MMRINETWNGMNWKLGYLVYIIILLYSTVFKITQIIFKLPSCFSLIGTLLPPDSYHRAESSMEVFYLFSPSVCNSVDGPQ